MLAAKNGHAEIVKAQIESGANMALTNRVSIWGWQYNLV